uniref:Reverse transcriptase domain-containing protein n=1 Tax=Cannabis sativa TaxID=3483 RepID=A0A803Q155_CANSA
MVKNILNRSRIAVPHALKYNLRTSVADAEGLIHGYKVYLQCPAISHLMYADDTFVFCRANNEEVDWVQDCLDKYCMWSGQVINVAKSALVFSKNVHVMIVDKYCMTVDEISNQLGYRRLSPKDRNPCSLLLFSRSKLDDFQFMVDWVKRRLQGWRSKLLSQGGQTTLLNFVISSTLLYTMSTFSLPKTICLAWINWLVNSYGSDPQRKIGSLFGKLGLYLFAKVETLPFGVRESLVGRRIGDIDLWCSPRILRLSWDDYVDAFNPRIRDPQKVTLRSLLDSNGVLRGDTLCSWFIPEVANRLDEDSLLHLFLHCLVARQRYLGSNWGIRSGMLSISSPLDLARNKAFHEGTRAYPSALLHQVSYLASEVELSSALAASGPVHVNAPLLVLISLLAHVTTHLEAKALALHHAVSFCAGRGWANVVFSRIARSLLMQF